MILDTGIIKICRVTGEERGKSSPTAGLPTVYNNWCGALRRESSGGGVRTMRVRIHEEDVREHDLADFAGKPWMITRVYHSEDDENGQPIADITMENGDRLFQRVSLIAEKAPGMPVNENGFANPATETAREVWCVEKEITHEEYAQSNAEGVRAGIKIDIYAAEYAGELLAEYKGRRYTVERTHSQGGVLIELTLDNAVKGGAAGGKV